MQAYWLHSALLLAFVLLQCCLALEHLAGVANGHGLNALIKQSTLFLVGACAIGQGRVFDIDCAKHFRRCLDSGSVCSPSARYVGQLDGLLLVNPWALQLDVRPSVHFALTP